MGHTTAARTERGTPRTSPLPSSIALEFPPEPFRVTQARHLGVAALREWGLDRLADTVEILISELVTNAVRYGGSEQVRVLLAHGEGEVFLAVDDGAPGRAHVRQVGPESESGRGMAIVQALSDAWGTDGPRTWCTVVAADTVSRGDTDPVEP
ncbi:ATP-binding protein [Streptomyces sp. DSM 44917]|uniref:ATP-binding protein n=1 Tax=Streptomyces boetiae TaxID=3075541 RepID=A0ABU2L8X1_9ACTN|nr:ATP-binding protein [Streptomyces sp. DSM 44917]MDT0307658.1 ATP-binding protein [Streptomyces sp. DSM 44917]